jgi:single-stranded-DNA-specific exonuclease
MQRRWTITPGDKSTVDNLTQSLKISPVICDLLVQRGITSFEAARDFFRPDLSSLHSPWLMKDMDKAVERLLLAFSRNEKILLFGDYDVDGTTAVATVYRFLKNYHSSLDFYIPHRYREGYGLSRAGIDFAAENGFSLIVSLDCGIKSVELVRYARTLGIDFIICDHHLPDEEVPAAVAVLNPKQVDCSYPCKELCGCGVGFKLISALGEKMGLKTEAWMQDLDLVATAIAADIVPITGENRILAFHGLKKANESPNNGIRALSSLSGLTETLLISNLVFMIAPRVNAAGRMDDARKAVQMFIADSYEEALGYAEQLHSDNTDRKQADKSITIQALEMIGANDGWTGRKTTVVYNPDWHKGVVGIVASRLIEHYHRPTVVLTRSGEYAAGSARSVPGFNLYEAIHACREHLLGYGGHYAAAGMTLELSQVDAFREKFESIVAASILPELLVPEIKVDAEIKLSDITYPLYRILCQMEPFGPGNLQPLFVSRNVVDTGWSKIVKEDHLRFTLRQGNTTITGIGFWMADKYPLLAGKKPVDIVYKIDENVWNGSSSLQLRVVDVKSSVL